MLIIGVYATARSGKSVFCSEFPKAYKLAMESDNIRIHYSSMSSIIKQNVSNKFGIKMESKKDYIDFYTSIDEKMEFSAKQMAFVPSNLGHSIGFELQRYALSLKEVIDDKYWIRATLSEIPKGTDVAIIDGVRYKSDVEMIEERGGHIVKIYRDDAVITDGRDANHKSEVDLNDYKNFKHVFNNETKPDLYLAKQNMMELIYNAYKPTENGSQY